jgi:hypothetical protein
LKKIERLAVLAAVSSIVLFLVYVPAFPAQYAVVTGHQAWLVCAALAMSCPSNPQFRAYNPGYASATYILFRFGTGPQLHYPIEITVYFTNVSTNVTIPVNVFLRDERTACVEYNIGQPPRCVS